MVLAADFCQQAAARPPLGPADSKLTAAAIASFPLHFVAARICELRSVLLFLFVWSH